MEEGVKRNGAKANFVAGVLGEEDTTGVLYLEFENSASQACENPILYFKALRETLAACLNL